MMNLTYVVSHMICTPLLKKGLQVLRPLAYSWFISMLGMQKILGFKKLRLKRSIRPFQERNNLKTFSRKSTRALQQFEGSDYRSQIYKYRHHWTSKPSGQHNWNMKTFLILAHYKMHFNLTVSSLVPRQIKKKCNWTTVTGTLSYCVLMHQNHMMGTSHDQEEQH